MFKHFSHDQQFLFSRFFVYQTLGEKKEKALERLEKFKPGEKAEMPYSPEQFESELKKTYEGLSDISKTLMKKDFDNYVKEYRKEYEEKAAELKKELETKYKYKLEMQEPDFGRLEKLLEAHKTLYEYVDAHSAETAKSVNEAGTTDILDYMTSNPFDKTGWTGFSIEKEVKLKLDITDDTYHSIIGSVIQAEAMRDPTTLDNPSKLKETAKRILEEMKEKNKGENIYYDRIGDIFGLDTEWKKLNVIAWNSKKEWTKSWKTIGYALGLLRVGKEVLGNQYGKYRDTILEFAKNYIDDEKMARLVMPMPQEWLDIQKSLTFKDVQKQITEQYGTYKRVFGTTIPEIEAADWKNMDIMQAAHLQEVFDNTVKLSVVGEQAFYSASWAYLTSMKMAPQFSGPVMDVIKGNIFNFPAVAQMKAIELFRTEFYLDVKNHVKNTAVQFKGNLEAFKKRVDALSDSDEKTRLAGQLKDIEDKDFVKDPNWIRQQEITSFDTLKSFVDPINEVNKALQQKSPLDLAIQHAEQAKEKEVAVSKALEVPSEKMPREQIREAARKEKKFYTVDKEGKITFAGVEKADRRAELAIRLSDIFTDKKALVVTVPGGKPQIAYFDESKGEYYYKKSDGTFGKRALVYNDYTVKTATDTEVADEEKKYKKEEKKLEV